MFLRLKTSTEKNRYFREHLYARDNGRCAVCGEHVEFDDMELDHVIPRTLGGEDHPRNLRVTHQRCNRSKGSKLGELRVQREPNTQNRVPLTMRLSGEGQRLLAALAAKWGVSQASVIELVIRDYA